MKNQLKVFNYNTNEVRMVEKNGEPWFVGNDVATALGYIKPRNAISIHVANEDKTTALIQGAGSNYKSKAILINESGLYALIFGSKLETAKQFKQWVTSEVLPTIRKTGSYAIKEDNAKLKEQMLKTREENVKVRKAQLMYKISQEVNIPEYKQVLQSHITTMLTGKELLPLPQLERHTYSATDIAQELGISSNKVGRLAKEYNLKTEEYGQWVWDKSRSSNKQVESFRYYNNVVDKLREIMGA